MPQEFLDVWRTMTAFLVAIGLILSLRNRIKYRDFFNAQERASMRAKLFLGFAPLVGLTWNLLKHASFNLGLPFVTVGAVFLIACSLAKPERLAATEEYFKNQVLREPD